jgi:Tol biopolymer transport system component
LPNGSQVGNYEIVSALGAGGMGEVYRARDTQLGREVALKILPEAFAEDPDRVARFQREAQLLASLNHPHIGAIYGTAESNGCRALVLELVEGPTLADRIQTGALEIDEALAIARQIVEALEAAHERGIIHRDLKPANVKVTPEGRVKVLDFGLAKMIHGEAASSSLTMSPTLSVHATLAGVILGTAAYMSPEQARGKAVDRRTDVWAFGCVLFEMLTGRRAFAAGETVSDVVAAILRSEPDWKLLPPATPPGIRRVLRRCLAKEPRERLHDIADARLEIRDAVTGEEPAAIRPQRIGNRIVWPLAAALAGAALALAVFIAGRPTIAPAVLPVYRSTIVPPSTAGFTNFGGRLALSPDGRILAFVADAPLGRNMLWVRRLDVGDERALAGTEGAANPFWSPDSRHVAFVVDGTLKRVDASGGPVLALSDGVGLSTGTWNRDDVILFAHESDGRIFRISAGGGTAAPVTPLDAVKGFQRHSAPFFLPDGRRFLYRVPRSETPVSRSPVDRGGGGIYVGSLDSEERTRLFEQTTTTMFANGHLVFMRGTTLMAQPFDVDRLVTTGAATPLAEQVQIGPAPAFAAAFSLSASGVIVFQAGPPPPSQLVWVDRGGKPLGALSNDDSYGYVQISPDGRQVAVSVVDSSTSRNRDLWIYDVARRIRTRFTTNPADEFAPVWSPDGSRLIFSGTGRVGLDLYSKVATGAAKEEPLVQTVDVAEIPVSWSPDGRAILFQTPTPVNDIWILPLTGDRKPVPFANSRFSELGGQFSPDGRWIAYSSNETGRHEVYVAPFGSGGKVAISSGGGELPRWRGDGKELFYLAPDNRLMAVPVDGSGTTVAVGDGVPLFAANLIRGSTFPYAVTADGQRFLINAPGVKAAPLPITLLVNWPGALKN